MEQWQQRDRNSSEKMRELEIFRNIRVSLLKMVTERPIQLFGMEGENICSTDSKILFQENKIRELMYKWKSFRELFHLKTDE